MRLIDADALLTVPNVQKVTEYDETGEGITYLAVPVEAIEKAPTIEAEPVRHGRWKTSHVNWRSGTQDDECTACGFRHHGEAMNQYKRCPNCGAIMDLKGE